MVLDMLQADRELAVHVDPISTDHHRGIHESLTALKNVDCKIRNLLHHLTRFL